MVHLCNIKMSAVSLRHKSKGRHYDIDGFISQLLASKKFDDLAEKLAEKAASKIIHVDKAPVSIQRATDDNEVKNSSESKQEIIQNRGHVNKFEKNEMNNVKLRKEFTGKINPQAVINTTISLSENLQLKYKYLKQNALEKRLKSNQNPLSKNDTQEEPSKHNKTTGPADFTEAPISNQNVTEKNQNDTEIQPFDENKRSRDDTKDDDRKEDPNRNSELNESCHSGTDGELNDRSNKPDNSFEELSSGNELTILRKAQNTGPEDKGIAEQEANQVNNNGIRVDKPSSLDEENQELLTGSEEKNIEEVEKTEEVSEKRATGEINEDENVIAQFRPHEYSIEDNKLTFNYNPHVGVYRTRASDDRGDDRSKEQSTEDQRSKEKSPENQRSKEESSEDQSSEEILGEDPNSSKLMPVIRKEGNKLYTYVRAPEYEDYHEKLAKWQKHHPENPADFMK